MNANINNKKHMLNEMLSTSMVKTGHLIQVSAYLYIGHGGKDVDMLGYDVRG